MTSRPVHWHEGMFIRPHHFQASHRHALHLAHTSEKWDRHYNWGLRSLDLDLNALSNSRLVVRALRARLRDGTLVSVPEDGTLPALDLKPALERKNAVTALLAVPVLQVGRANVADGNGRAEGSRFYAGAQELEDENTGLHPQEVQVRHLNLSLRLSTEGHAGYEVLPLARVQRSPGAQAAPELDLNFIPPVLACDAWKPLQDEYLRAVYHRIGRLMRDRGQDVQSKNISLDSRTQGDALILARLRAYSEAYAVLGVLASLEGLHPLTAYLELCRLVGQLAVFGRTGLAPELPPYDHDDLGGCFPRVRAHLDDLLGGDQPPRYVERPFQGVGLRLEVALEADWAEPAYQLFVGVHSPLERQECVDLLTDPNRLDMKVSTAERVEDIYRRGLPGLRFTHAGQPPRALPTPEGLVYFQANREGPQDEWQHVRQQRTLAIRLNEKFVGGTMQGRTAPIRHAGETVPLQFTLYVLRGEG